MVAPLQIWFQLEPIISFPKYPSHIWRYSLTKKRQISSDILPFFFHGETIGEMRQVPLWKKYGYAIMIQLCYSLSLQVLTFYFPLSCKIRHRHHFFLKGNFSIKTCKFFNGALADKRFVLIFLIKTFPR